jgi:cobalt-zinc-cadmium resistance protein CzcA
MPQVIIEYNRPLIAQYHLSISDINRIVNAAFAGQSTGLVFEGEKRFDMVVRLDSKDRKNVMILKIFLFRLLLEIRFRFRSWQSRSENGPNQIQRENAQRRIVVGFNIKGEMQSIVEELQGKVDKEMKLPTGYYMTYGGSFENLNNAKQRLMIAVPIALALIFVMLFLHSNPLKKAC